MCGSLAFLMYSAARLAIVSPSGSNKDTFAQCSLVADLMHVPTFAWHEDCVHGFCH